MRKGAGMFFRVTKYCVWVLAEGKGVKAEGLGVWGFWGSNLFPLTFDGLYNFRIMFPSDFWCRFIRACGRVG